MAFDISVRSDLAKITKSLDNFVSKQIPFATATALTAVGKLVQKAEVERLKETLKNPSTFTLKSVGLRAARKLDWRAIVFVKPLAAEYLEPYESGGAHHLNSKALLNPKDIKLNQYGQLSRGTLAALKGRPDIFIGPVTTAKGTINGVWQRAVNPKKAPVIKGKRLRGLNKMVMSNGTLQGRLKLLIRFGDALPVQQHLDYRKNAEQVVAKNFEVEFRNAYASALASAR